MDAGFGRLYHAPVDVVLDDENVFVPRLSSFVSTNRLSMVQETHVHGAPDIVVEILSPGTNTRDLRATYSLCPLWVRFYWVADTFSRTIQVFELPAEVTLGEPEAFLEGEDPAAVRFSRPNSHRLRLFRLTSKKVQEQAAYSAGLALRSVRRAGHHMEGRIGHGLSHSLADRRQGRAAVLLTR